ncbi:hypothetical protein ACC808_11715 [Rhizobium ruizarguesonis]
MNSLTFLFLASLVLLLALARHYTRAPLINSTSCFIFGAQLLYSGSLLAADVSAATASHAAITGDAYDSDRQIFVGQSCIKGHEVKVGATSSTLNFDQHLNEAQVASQLGFAAGGRAQYGAVTASAEARFFRSVKSNDYSVSAVWESEYRLPTTRLIDPSLTVIGSAVSGDDIKWRETCGDQYVTEIERGARLFFSIRIEFSSKERREEFETKFAISGPLYSASASLNTASQQFSRDAKVTISALQTGGDVSKLTALFPDTDGAKAGFVACTLGDFQKCSEVIQAALHYAADTKNGFSSQLTDEALPNSVLYKTTSYGSAGIFPKWSSAVNQEVVRSRSTIQAEFERSFNLQGLIGALLLASPPQDKRDLIVAEQKKNDRNIAAIVAVAQTCYDNPIECPSAASRLQLENIDSTVLALPPLATGSFRLMTTNRNVWRREDSVQLMTDPTVWDAAHTRCDSGGFFGCAYSNFQRDSEILEYFWKPGIGASIVLYIEGTSLREATVFFEGRQIKVIPLSDPGRAKDGRYTDDHAILVIDTNRGNPGWMDIDLQNLTLDLTKDMPSADGIFYVVIRDGFGREKRFDIVYEEWRSWVDNGNANKTLRFANVVIKNRWWDVHSSGTNATGSGPWSLNDTGRIGRIE